MTEWWARIAEKHDFSKFPEDEWLTVFLPMQPWHVSRQGHRSQADLTGQGAIDVKITFPTIEGDSWTFQEAVAHSEKVFQNFKAESESKILFVASLEALSSVAGARLAPLCRAPSKLTSQPICVPAITLQEVIAESEKDVWAFEMLLSAGVQSIQTKSLDLQPALFREWFGEAVMGSKTMPGKRPKAWSILPRDWLIMATITTLTQHGLNQTRNDTTEEQHSAYDAIAEAAKRQKINGVSSYETVKTIVRRLKARHLWVR